MKNKTVIQTFIMHSQHTNNYEDLWANTFLLIVEAHPSLYDQYLCAIPTFKLATAAQALKCLFKW